MTKSNWKSGVETLFVLSVFVVLLILVAVEGETSLEFLSLEFWSANSKGEALRNIAFAIGTPAALLLAYLRTNSAGAQAETGVRQANLAEKRQNIDRFQSGIELMGSDDVTVRIGGLTVLKQVAETDPDGYYIALQEFLLTYMQYRCNLALSQLGGTGDILKRNIKDLRTPLDVEQAIHIVSSLRTAENCEREKLQLWTPKLREVFFNGSDLQGLKLHDMTIEDVRFEDCSLFNSDFSRSDLGIVSPSTTFIYCKFSKSRFDDHSAYKCDLRHTQFKKCDFRKVLNKDIVVFMDAKFEECNFSESRLIDLEDEKQERLAYQNKANELARDMASD